MIGVALKIILLGAIVILIVCVIGLFVMSGVAQSHDVVRVPVPPGTFIAGTQAAMDYSDAYLAPMRYASFRDINRVAEQAFHRGKGEVYRSDTEVAYEGESAGIYYYISYVLTRDTSPATLVVATTVKIKEKKGRYYWMFAKPVHRRLLPYMLDRMVIMAPN